MNSIRRCYFLSFALLGLASPLIHAQNLTRPSEVVYFHGAALQSSHVINVSDLAAVPADMLGTFTQSRASEKSEQRTTVRGVRLAPLIERLGLRAAARAEWKNLWVTVTATDGCRAQFSWVELVNSPIGDGVLLIFERDGQPLDTREGRIALLSSADFRLGARHVRNALRVEVRQIAD